MSGGECRERELANGARANDLQTSSEIYNSSRVLRASQGGIVYPTDGVPHCTSTRQNVLAQYTLQPLVTCGEPVTPFSPFQHGGGLIARLRRLYLRNGAEDSWQQHLGDLHI